MGQDPDLPCVVARSISRHHATLSFDGPDGIDGTFLTDEGSTHGTRLDSVALTPRVRTRLRPGPGGSVVRFGQSSRTYHLHARVAVAASNTAADAGGGGSGGGGGGGGGSALGVDGVCVSSLAPPACPMQLPPCACRLP